jgi:hypothetical protein
MEGKWFESNPAFQTKEPNYLDFSYNKKIQYHLSSYANSIMPCFTKTIFQLLLLKFYGQLIFD